MKKLFASLIIFMLFILQACNIINPKETVPTYIKIDSVQVLPTITSTHGSVSHKITDVWVYYDRQLLGPYELPAKIPVLATTKGQLQLVAGIWDNGLSGTRVKYPFYNVDTFTFSPSPTNTISYTPKFIYRTADTPKINYFIENFEQGNGLVKLSGDTSFTRTNIAGEVFEEDWSAKLNLDTAATYAEAITGEQYSLTPNKEAYLELNYKSEAPLFIATKIYHLGTYETLDIINLKSRDTWTKVYLNLTGFAASYQNGKFQFIIKAVLPEGTEKAKVLIDNLKVIYFN